MKTSVLALATVVAASCGSVFAQSAPLRGLGLLALDSSAAQRASNVSTGGRAMLDAADGGGGMVGARAARGGDEVGAGSQARADAGMTADTLPPSATIVPIDPALPAVSTPKHPSYRWQALVPGALK